MINNYLSKTKIKFIASSLVVPSLLFTSCNFENSNNIESPNVILIFIDDMGYGDLGCYGSELNRTPNLDKLAEEGIRFRDFSVASSVCTPSRAALLTGCYPMRVDMASTGLLNGMVQVLFPVSKIGLNPSEITIAEILKEKDYRTACIGKWHLGDQLEFLPTKQGFDYYYGIPYSNDMGTEQSPANPPLPLMEMDRVIDAPVNQDLLTKNYTDKTIEFIQQEPEKPFFIYLPHSMVHWPLHASDDFRGKSANGIFGDAVEEIDWSVGKIIEYLKDSGLDENTLIIFTSDNGGVPRLGSSNLPLSGAKGTILEGGFRVPFIARWPGKIPGGIVSDAMMTSMDIMPTISEFCNAKMPDDRIIDGKSFASILLGETKASPRTDMYYYQKNQLQAVRSNEWKLYLPLENKFLRPWDDSTANTAVKLFNLKEDLAESRDVSKEHPEIITKLMRMADSIRLDIGDYGKVGENVRKAATVEKARPLTK